MSIVSFSDLHYSHKYPESKRVWGLFCRHPKVMSANTVILLGDMFDLMIGGKKQYLDYYKDFFSDLKTFIQSGKKVIFVEGNHDFHIENVFKSFLKSNNLDVKLFEYYKDEFVIKCGEENILFCHGDIVDETNESFKKWKKIYRNKLFEFFTNYILPFFVIRKVGERASQDSKNRNSRAFNYDKSKQLYRNGAESVLNQFSVKILVTGHTHIIDKIKTGSGLYINNGFPQKDETFIEISSSGCELISLTGSYE